MTDDATIPPPATPRPRREKPEKIRCDACPVLCFIAEGRAGACDRYANVGGVLTRVDPLVILDRTVQAGGEVVTFLDDNRDWEGDIVQPPARFVTAVGAGTTYPDYKPAPFIVSSQMEGVD
ncbi:MAG TPA: 6-hydroxynicotinate reductase, partial [Paracoccus sp.]|nr:6-hydroxynicotinate reductase [Paracoccus sp. (in: a-proteobacteria)]